MIFNEINNQLLKKIRLNLAIGSFLSADEDIVPKELTHDYLLHNFPISTQIENYYYSPCVDMLLKEDYELMIKSGYIGDTKTTLRPYPFIYKGAYIQRKQLYFRLEHLMHQKLKYKNKSITDFESLFPYFEDYREGFKVGYNNFENDCIEKYLPMFPDKNDFIQKVFEYTTKSVIFEHSWENNHKGFTINFLKGTNKSFNLLEDKIEGEIIEAFEDGKFQGYFYRAWSIILSNNNLFDKLFNNISENFSNPNDNIILNDILFACYTMQQNKHFWNTDEDTKTKQVLDLLQSKYIVKDQSTYGESSSGKKAGRIDGVIIDKGKEYFLEAFNLSGLNKQYIKTHIDKLEMKYDSKGLKEKYLLIYYNLDSNKFNIEVIKYKEYLEKEHQFIYNKIKNIEEIKSQYTDSRVFKTYHTREGEDTVIYHLLFKIPK